MFQNNVKRNVKRTAYFTIITEPIHPFTFANKQNKNKTENLCRPLTDMSRTPSHNIQNHFEISPITMNSYDLMNNL